MGDRSNPDSYFFARMRNKNERLGTYHDYPPTAHVTPDALAAAGFFYTGNGDDAKCAFCTEIIGDWEEGDDPMEDHKKHIPHCKFVQGQDLGDDLDLRSQQDLSVADACQPRSQTAPQSNGATSAPVKSKTTYIQRAILDLEHTRMLVDKFGMEDVKKAIEMGINKHGESFDSEVHLCDIILDLQSVSSPVTPPHGGPSTAVCKTCKTRNANAKFIPCGHRSLCTQCVNSPKFCQDCGQAVSNIQTVQL